jgi:DedD protein
MAEQAQTTPDDDSLKKRLIGRIAVAGVVIAGLLGGLAVFDAMNTPPPEKVAALPTKPISEPLQKEPAPGEATKDEPVKTEEKPAENAVAEKPVAAEPERSASTAAPAFTEPKVASTARAPTKPATAQPAMHKPSEPVVVARPDPGQEIARSQDAAATHHAPASRPLAQVIEATRHYLFQLGVFNNTANAEELRAKLTLNGIPAVVETRVQAGPFSTRGEADAARKKLVELEMQPGPIISAKK